MQLPSGMELVPLAPERKAQMDGYAPVAEYNKKVRAVFKVTRYDSHRLLPVSELWKALRIKRGLPG